MYVSACALYALRSTAAIAPLFVLAATKADPTLVFAEEREEVEGKREGAVANMRIEWRDFEHEPVYFESGTWKQAKRVRVVSWSTRSCINRCINRWLFIVP